MTDSDRSRLRTTRHRAMSLLLGVELLGPEADDPAFPARTAAALREVAGLCMTWLSSGLAEGGATVKDYSIGFTGAHNWSPPQIAQSACRMQIDNAIASAAAALEQANDRAQAVALCAALRSLIEAKFGGQP